MTTRVGGLVLLVTVLVLGPTLPSSEAGGHRFSGKDVVLYELTEQARFTVDAEERLHRVATSGLEGKARRGTPLCPEDLMAHAENVFRARQRTVKDSSRCTVVAFGKSDLDVTEADLGIVQGTIKGKIYLVVNSVLTNLTDAPELVVMSGSFTGTVVVTDPAIITITEGTVTGDDAAPTFCPAPAGCTFTGKFRQPFTVHRVAVYKKDNGSLVPVLPDERALGDPTVRLEITFD